MFDPKNNLVAAACGGSLVMILTYAVTYVQNGEGRFWLSLLLGAGVLAGLYLLLLFHGLHFAAMLDSWERENPDFEKKAPAMVRGGDGFHKSAMVYFFPEYLVMVFRQGKAAGTRRVNKTEVIQLLFGKEDTELILQGTNAILSFDWGEEEEESRLLADWAGYDRREKQNPQENNTNT